MKKQQTSTFDRASFFAGSFTEVAAWQRQQIASMPVKERLHSAWLHTMRVYGLDPENLPPFDRTLFSMRKHEKR
jgi:hypothetical protein